MMKRKFKKDNIAPMLIFITLVVILGIITNGMIFTKRNMMNIFSQSVTTIISGLGMLFVASMGGTDITHGSLIAVAAAIAAIAGNAFGAAWMFPVAMAIGVASGLFLGVVNVKLHVPSFMASLSMLIAMRALSTLIISSGVIKVPSGITFIDGNIMKLVILVALILIVLYIFHYTRYGTYVRAIGENENAVRFVGINVDKIKIIAFVTSGIMAGIAAVFTIVRVGGASNTLGNGFEMKVMMALFIGGIPVEGGMGSKLYKVLLGAVLIVVLENGLVLCGATGGVTQLIRGIVLLGAVYITRILNDKFVLMNNAKKIVDKSTSNA